MNTPKALVAAVLTVVLTSPLFGQHNHADMKTKDMNRHDMSMLGKPTVDATVGGVHMKVWLVTQKEHRSMMKDNDMMGMKRTGMGTKDTSMGMGKGMKSMNHDGMGMGGDMKGMKHDGMEMDKATKDAMMSGTHHIMLDVTDAASGKEITNTSAKLLIVSPSKRNSSVDLRPMMGHFGNGLALDEKGDYQFTVSVNVDGVSKTKQFQYAVK